MNLSADLLINACYRLANGLARIGGGLAEAKHYRNCYAQGMTGGEIIFKQYIAFFIIDLASFASLLSGETLTSEIFIASNES